LLCDKGSSNGTFINGARLAGNTVCQLRHNDRVRFGDVQFRFELRPQVAAGTGVSAGAIATGAPRLQRPGEERVQFEIDMCIGCNRCMDVCPVPMSSQVFIADLNTATTSDRIASHVAHFTHDCILCGSCVPVCPVDNHRDLLMFSLKERLGVSWNSK